MFGRRKGSVAVPKVGEEAPEFHLPSAQGGQLRLSMRTVRGPVVVVFYRPGSEEDVGYFEALAGKEDEINLASGSVVGIGVAEAGDAREFVRASGIKSYVLYDYTRVASREWGLLERNKDRGEYSRPAVFVVDGDHKVTHAWVGDRPSVEEVLAAVSGITSLPKPAEEDGDEKPKKKAAEAGDEEAAGGGAAGEAEGAEEKPKKLSAEERERIKAERRAAREAGKSVKTGESDQKAASGEPPAGEKAKKMSAEDRERIKAERRAAREAGKPLKTSRQPEQAPEDGVETANEKPAEASAEQAESPKNEKRPEPGEARVEAEVDAGSRAGDEGEEESGSLPEGAEAGERQEKKRAEEE